MTIRKEEKLPSLCGITGFAQHGKDTVGGILTLLYGYKRFAFADQVRELALRVNPIIMASQTFTVAPVPVPLAHYVKALGWEEAKKHGEVRRILVELGMGVRDVVGSDAWVDACALVMRGVDYPVVLTDVRFPNEVDWVLKNGGVIIRVTRYERHLYGTPTASGLKDVSLGEEMVEAVPHNNPAEVHVPHLLANWDIRNDGDIDDLRGKVAGIMKDLSEGFVPVPKSFDLAAA